MAGFGGPRYGFKLANESRNIMSYPMVGFHPIVYAGPPWEISTSRKTHSIHPNWDVKSCLRGVGGSDANNHNKVMSIGTILLIVLVLLLIGAFPTWPHSRSWGYFPSGLLGIVLVILIILLVLGKI
jgi:hypothetical protein